MWSRLFRLTFGFTLITYLSACAEDVDSGDVKTADIYAAIDITSTKPDDSEVKVILAEGDSNSNTFLDLTSGDTLTASLNSGSAKVLKKSTDPLDSSRISYSTTFSDSLAGAAGSVYVVALNRSGDASAPNSSVTVPATLDNFSHNGGFNASFSRAASTLTLSWDPGSAGSRNLTLNVSGNCLQTYTNASVPDNGSFILGAGTLVASPTGGSCIATAELGISQFGSLDANYGEGGYIKVHKSAVATFTSTP